MWAVSTQLCPVLLAVDQLLIYFEAWNWESNLPKNGQEYFILLIFYCRKRFTPERSPTELGLGVAFGLIGAGVFGVVGYYVIKEYRRRLRIRRFLQYR